MHPFLYPELVDALRDDRIRYRRTGWRHRDSTPIRRRDPDS